MRRLWILLGCSAFVACGGKDDHPPAPPPSIGTGGNTNLASSGGTGGATTMTTGGKTSTGGSVSSAGDQGEAGEGGANSLAPLVEILSPLEVLDPNAGAVLVGETADTVTVVCKASAALAPGAADVDSSSVLITVLDGDGKVVDQHAGKATSKPNQYSWDFVVRSVVNGALSFRCTASDSARPANTASATISSFIDHGPEITVVTPVENSAHGLSEQTKFEFTALPSPLWASADRGATVAAVSLVVDGIEINSLAADPKRPGTYTANVDFNDTKLFKVTPTGSIAVTISADDKRAPIAATRVKSYAFQLDGTGPAITITSPAAQSVIGGPKPTQVQFNVKDDGAGTNVTTVGVRINNSSFPYTATDSSWSYTSNSGTTSTKDLSFKFAFDASKVEGSDAQLTVNVDATDLAGNYNTSSLVLHLDEMSPVVSLDPPNARIITSSDDPDHPYCSASFDPVGPDAPSDGDRVPLNALFRTFIWERTNGAPSAAVRWFAGVDAKTPHLYLQTDTSKPILIDTNGDGECDAINPEVKSQSSHVLEPITPTGIGDTNANVILSSPPDVSDLDCKSQAVDLKGLCLEHTSFMTFVAGQHIVVPGLNGNRPAVWGIAVGSDQSYTCTGTQWEVGSAAPTEGWLCLAAEAADAVGNSAVSPPLRVCFDSELTSTHPTCATSSTTPPSCTDGCKPPPQDFGYGDGKPFLIGY